MDLLLNSIRTRKDRLDQMRPLPVGALKGLQKFYDFELTYTSNALEGNALTYRETGEVIEHGVTVGGKLLRDHLEAVDHYEALQWMRELAGQTVPLSEMVVRELHRRIVTRSQPEIAGLYSCNPRRIPGSTAIFAGPVKIPQLMAEYGTWLEEILSTPVTGFEAHYRLTAIRPFADGNGRTARLLMNLILLRGGYPPVAVRPEDRTEYLDALENASLAGDPQPFQAFMHARLDTTLDEYLTVLERALPPAQR
jgi:Fic family protein